MLPRNSTVGDWVGVVAGWVGWWAGWVLSYHTYENIFGAQSGVIEVLHETNRRQGA